MNCPLCDEPIKVTDLGECVLSPDDKEAVLRYTFMHDCSVLGDAVGGHCDTDPKLEKMRPGNREHDLDLHLLGLCAFIKEEHSSEPQTT